MKILFNQVFEVLKDNIEKNFNISITKGDLQNSTKLEFGDFQTNFAMAKSKELGKKPIDIAQELVNNFNGLDVIDKLEIKGPGFINIFVKNELLNEDIRKIGNEKYEYNIDANKKVLIDYSAPNIAKRMHVGHLRSTIIGDSLKRIYKELGFNVISDNHIGDWGTQFGKLIVAYNHWLDKENYDKNPIEELERLYVLFSKKSKEDPKLEDLAREELRKVQSGDEKNIKLWKEFITVSLKEYDKIYDRLDIKFDYINGESFYNDLMPKVLELLKQKNIAKEDDKALVVFFEEDKLPPAIVQKKDGSFLYATSDMATIIYRYDDLKIDKAIYVVDERQSGHFKQIFEISKMLGSPYNYDKEHVAFGIMRFGDGLIFSSREGNVIRLTDLLDEAKVNVRKLVIDKNPDLSEDEIDNLSEKIAVAAIKYFDLSQNRISPITFTWDKVLSFEGNSGPYLQYTYVRIQSILNKSNEFNKNADALGHNFTQIERDLAVYLLRFPTAVIKAYENNRPNIIAEYLYDLSKIYNAMYNSVKIMGDENKLALIYKTSVVLKQGLSLLGIDVVNKM